MSPYNKETAKAAGEKGKPEQKKSIVVKNPARHSEESEAKRISNRNKQDKTP